MVRGSLGNTDVATTVTARYPFCAMPVVELLKLDAWRPHQDLLAEGVVVEMTNDMLKEADVIFVSHQWVAFNHPDPASEQLTSLKSVLSQLMEGKHAVESNYWLNAVYQTNVRITPEQWKERLPKMYVWFDYTSIPQPGALVAKASDSLKSQLDANGDGMIEQAELVDARVDRAELAPGKSHDATDHRHAIETTDAQVLRLIEQLKAAVESIPSYIEKSAMMWLLVPACKHHDIERGICDFNSWRKRGWCRMEARLPAVELAARARACPRPVPLPSPSQAAEIDPSSRSLRRASSPAATTCPSWSSAPRARCPSSSTRATRSSSARRTATSPSTPIARRSTRRCVS
jgi:hypothetical protein